MYICLKHERSIIIIVIVIIIIIIIIIIGITFIIIENMQHCALVWRKGDFKQNSVSPVRKRIQSVERYAVIWTTSRVNSCVSPVQSSAVFSFYLGLLNIDYFGFESIFQTCMFRRYMCFSCGLRSAHP